MTTTPVLRAGRPSATATEHDRPAETATAIGKLFWRYAKFIGKFGARSDDLLHCVWDAGGCQREPPAPVVQESPSSIAFSVG